MMEYRWIRDNRTTQMREFYGDGFAYDVPAKNFKDWGKYPDAPNPPEQLEEIMGTVAADEYREAVGASMLYGRMVKDMSRDELLLVIGFLLREGPRTRLFPA